MPEVEYIFYGTPEQFCAVAAAYAARYQMPYTLIHLSSYKWSGNRLVKRGTGIIFNKSIAIDGIWRADGTTCRLEIAFNPDAKLPQSELETITETFLERLRRDGWKIIRIDYSAKSIETIKVIESIDMQPATEGPPIEQTTAQTPSSNLNQRENEVLVLVRTGSSRQEIAEKLMLQPTTIDTYVQSICQKLKLPKITKSTKKLRLLMEQNEKSD